MPKKDLRKEALRLLATGISQTRTAEVFGVSRRTVVRWLGDSQFQSELLSCKRRHLEEVLDQSLQLSDSPTANEVSAHDSESSIDSLISKALAALHDVLSNPESRSSDRLRSAELVLKLLAHEPISQKGAKPNPRIKPIELSDEDREKQIDRLLQRRELLQRRCDELKSQLRQIRDC